LMMQSLINKISHNPLVRIKEYAASDDGYEKIDIARELFGVDYDDVESSDDSSDTGAPVNPPDPENRT
jgi:hypothetical protein